MVGGVGASFSTRKALGVAAVTVVASTVLILITGRVFEARSAPLAGTDADELAAAPLVRAGLVDRMRQHGEALDRLNRSATLLDYDEVAEAAHAILDEPRIPRPDRATPDDLNSQLPPAYFELQDALYAETKALGQAARERDDRRLGQAYGRLAQTCIGCHALSLTAPSPPSPHRD